MSERIPPSSRRLRKMASDYEEAVGKARSEQLAARAIARAEASQVRPRRQLAAVVGAAAMLFVLVGVGYGAAKSLPGDPLYGVSRAVEGVGELVGVVDPVEQRLHEVIALAERGDGARAVQIASEALDELNRSTGVTVPLPPIAALTTSTTTTSTTTTEASGQTTPTVAADPTTSSTSAPTTTNALPTVDATDDPIEDLKVAAELLLNRVKDNGGEIEDAAAGLAAAVSTLAAEGEEPLEEGDPTSSTSSSTSSTSTTTTTEPKASTTTIPGSTTSSSTTTTVPGDEGEVEEPNPIFIPPSPGAGEPVQPPSGD